MNIAVKEFETVRLDVKDVVVGRESEALTVVVYHRGGATSARLSSTEPLEIGRAPPCGLVIPDESLSRKHARLRVVEGQVYVEDLGSTNGTRVGDREVVSETPVALTDRVMLGSVELRISTHGPAARAARHVEGYDLFRQHLDDEVVRARHFGRRAALLVVRAEMLNGASTEARHGHAWAHAGAIVPRVTALLAPVDRVALFSRDTLFVLLPEVDDDRLTSVLAGLIKKGELPPLIVGSAVLPTDAATADELIDVAREALGKTTAATPSQRASSGAKKIMPAAAGDKANALLFQSTAMRELTKTIAQMQRSHIPVLIHGETGAGKEVVARAVHEGGPRHGKPMISLNCGALQPTLLEATLFGTERGVATDVAARAGVFEAAEGGTVFLDEIGELSASAQAALLRVLETKKVCRLGSTKEISVDARIIAASHRDLDEMVQRGQFREDLLFRLNALILRVPPLRERKDEIVPLAHRFIADAVKSAGSPTTPSLSADAIELMQSYAWPGNVRELKNAMERAVAIVDGDVIRADTLPERVQRMQVPAPRPPLLGTVGATGGPSDANSGNGSGDVVDLRELVSRYEKQVIEEMLAATGGNQTEAARRLMIPLRTLVDKIKKKGVDKKRSPK